ncbi:hypothetical protein [Nostoc sp. DedQUE09]|uniref:hypothetical protein n=1 Tax=Nostoc sp. DedQUE09 TaxID=3075394 RepID=UPI002AD47BCC|nr:hypothetical protein [Nostoc sp. DedQUE09]MDZ7955884.1 hypothetical protein [Nostoc sp. DedQUE09]
MKSLIDLPEKFKSEVSLIAASEFKNVRYEVILQQTPPSESGSIFIDFECYSNQEESTSREIDDLSFITTYDCLRFHLDIIINSGFLLHRDISSYTWLNDDDEPIEFSSRFSKQFEKISANLYPLFQDYFFTPHNLYTGI